MIDKRCVPIEVRQRGQLVGVFPSVRTAARVLQLNEKKLSDCLRGHQERTGDGFSASYFDRRAYGARKR